MSAFDIFIPCFVVSIMVILPLILFVLQRLLTQKLTYLLSLDTRYEFFQELWSFLHSWISMPRMQGGYSIWTMNFGELISGARPKARPSFSEQAAASEFERVYLKGMREGRKRGRGYMLPVFQTIFFSLAYASPSPERSRTSPPSTAYPCSARTAMTSSAASFSHAMFRGLFRTREKLKTSPSATRLAGMQSGIRPSPSVIFRPFRRSALRGSDT